MGGGSGCPPRSGRTSRTGTLTGGTWVPASGSGHVVATPPPRAVIFDFGGGIWNMGWAAARALETAHGLPEGGLHATLYGGGARAGAERAGGGSAARVS